MPVKVFRINKEEIVAKLKVWAEKISQDKNVLAVALFGSFAKNEYTPASDADILIILKESKDRFDNRIPHFIPRKVGISVDVFPYTIEEFISLYKENEWIKNEIVKNGVLLYGVDNIKENNSFQNWFLRIALK